MTDVVDRYGATQDARSKADGLSEISSLRNQLAQQEPQSVQPMASAPQGDGVIKGIGKGIMGGFGASAKLFTDAADYWGQHLANEQLNLSKTTADYWKTDSVAGQFAKSITEFGVGFIPAMRLAKAAGITNAVAQSSAAGAAASFTTVDPDAERLSTLINEHFPSLKNPITEYLAADGDDSEIEKRFKNTVENSLLGVATDGAIKSVQGIFKVAKSAWGPEAAKKLMDVDAAQAAKAAEVATAKEGVEAGLTTTVDEATAMKSQLDDLVTKAEQAKASGAQAIDQTVPPELLDNLKKAGAIPEAAESVGLDELKNASKLLGEQLPQKAVAPALRISTEEAGKIIGDVLNGNTAKDLEAGLHFNYDRMNTSDDIKGVIARVAKTVDDHINTNSISLDTTGKQADLLYREQGIDIRGLAGDTKNLAARATAGRLLLTDSANRIYQMADLIKGIPTSSGFPNAAAAMAARDEALLAMRQQVIKHAEIQAQIKGTQTEIARALSSFRINSIESKASMGELDTLLQGLGGRELNLEFAEKLAALRGNPKGLNNFIQKGAGAKTYGALQEVWMNSILSSPVTHSANIIGNSLRAIGTIAENYGAATANLIRGGQDGITFREATAYTHGMLEGLLDTLGVARYGNNGIEWFRGSADTFRSFAMDTPLNRGLSTGAAGEMADLTGIATRNIHDAYTGAGQLTHNINSANFNTGSQWANKFIDYMGTFIRVPGRMLQSEDQLFWDLNHRGALRAAAYRTARTEGKEGADLGKRMAELMENPTKELSEEAIAAAEKGTFTQKLDPKSGDFMDIVGNWLTQGKARIPGLNFMIPFIRTPTNIMKYTFDRMPILAQASASQRAMWQAGGRQRDQLIAQQTFGGTMLAMGWYFASQGHITGGDMLGTKAAQGESGYQKYSVKVGDTYYSYNRLDPIGQFLAFAADTVDMLGHMDVNEVDELAAGVLTATGKYWLDKSYLQGITETVGMINDSVRAPVGQSGAPIKKWAGQIATGFMPYSGAFNQVNRSMIDPEMKEVYGLADQFKAKIPGLSKDLYPKRHLISGEPVVFEGGLGPDMVSPIFSKKEVDEPYAKALASLNIDMKPPAKFIGKVNLTNEEYDRLTVLMTQEVKSGGVTLKEALNRLVESPQWERYSSRQGDYEGSQEYAFKRTYDSYKQAAQARLLQENPELKALVMQDKTNKGAALLGQPIMDIDRGDAVVKERSNRVRKIIGD